jgi:N-acyl homoserine lactone hydrolase
VIAVELKARPPSTAEISGRSRGCATHEGSASRPRSSCAPLARPRRSATVSGPCHLQDYGRDPNLGASVSERDDAHVRTVRSGLLSPRYDLGVSARVMLYLFSSGTLEVGGVEVPVPFFLIRHPEGDVVVDGGNPLAVARDARAHWGGLADQFRVRMTEEQHCVAQLRELGIAPESVSHLVQSHLHIDHTGALGHFPDATVIVQSQELDAARIADPPHAHGYVREDFDRAGLDWRAVEGGLDLFGDGAIRLLSTPGHSAGHMSLLLQLEETGRVLLTADAADNRAQWDGQLPPRALYSRDDARRSLERLRELARATDSLVVFGHDLDNWSQLRHAPDHYT